MKPSHCPVPCPASPPALVPLADAHFPCKTAACVFACVQVFDRLDVDHDGTISTAELLILVNKNGSGFSSELEGEVRHTQWAQHTGHSTPGIAHWGLAWQRHPTPPPTFPLVLQCWGSMCGDICIRL